MSVLRFKYKFIGAYDNSLYLLNCRLERSGAHVIIFT